MLRNWIRGLTLAGLGLTVVVGGALAQDREGERGQPERDGERRERRDGERPRADLPGPIDNPQDLQDTARMVFMMADTNHDGEISKR